MIWAGPTPMVILGDPKLVREVLSNKFGHFRKPKLPANLIKMIADGLSNHDGEKWAVHRKIINHGFHLEKLKVLTRSFYSENMLLSNGGSRCVMLLTVHLTLQRMLPAFTTCTSELIKRWEDSMGSGKAQEIDVWPELQDLTGDAISRAAFGSSLTEGRRIFRIQSEQVQLLNSMTNLYIPGYTYVSKLLTEDKKLVL